MFKKGNKLTRAEFSEYFKKGKRDNSNHLTIITHPLDKTKVSVVVGKKVAKSAAKRNVIKRRIYASLRDIYDKESLSGTMIVIVKPSFNSLPRKAADTFLREKIAEVIKSK